MSLAILMAAVSRVLRYTEIWNLPSGDKLELLAFTISFIGIGNIFHLAFGLEVFSNRGSKSKVAITIISIYSVLIAGFIVYAIYAGLFVEDLTTLIWGLAIGLSVFVYGWTMIAALGLARKLERGPDKSATIWISISPMSIMMVFIMFFVDRIVGGNFSPFYYAGWAFVVVSILSMFLGIIRPKWAYKR
jgi:hypothetical protein